MILNFTLFASFIIGMRIKNEIYIRSLNFFFSNIFPTMIHKIQNSKMRIWGKAKDIF